MCSLAFESSEAYNIMQFGINTQCYFCGRATTKRRAYANEGEKGGHESTFSHFIMAVIFSKFVCYILGGNIIFDHVHNDRNFLQSSITHA